MTAEAWYDSGSFITVEDHRIFYRMEGSGPALCCMHGFPTSSWDFDPIWNALTRHFTVIATDLIGLGRSAKPAIDLTVSMQADVITEVLISIGINEAHILAHDLGDTVAQELLARQKDGNSKINWKTCVLLNGGIFPETHRPKLIQKLLLSPVGSFIAKLSSESTFRRNMISIFSNEHPPSEEFLSDSWRLLTENEGKSMLPRLIKYMEERRAFRDRWIDPLVEKTVPVRLINGTQDPISGMHAAQRFEVLIPEADVVLLKDAGHYPHVEVPEKVTAEFLGFHESLNTITTR